MTGLSNLVDWLEGKKTYLVCLIGILAALLAYLNHQINLVQLAEAIFAALGGASLRSAQNTTAQKVIDATQAAAAVQPPAVQLPNTTASGANAVDPNDLG